jgi:L-amino acid N-acyltransferase YncA
MVGGPAQIDPPSPPSLEVRALAVGDAPAFARFVAGIPPGERRFLKEDLPELEADVAPFLQRDDASRMVAMAADGEVVGLAGAFPGAGWSSHVAELRVLVASSYRQRGAGRTLAQAGLIEALKLRCSHVFVEVIAEQEALIVMFQSLGFEPEALLGDFVRDGEGRFRDLMLLTHRVADHAATAAVLGLDGTE